MKKIFSILLLLVYTILTMGMTVIVHTCGGESKAMVAASTAEDPCGCADEMPVDKCCTTEVSTVKLDDAQKISTATIIEKLTVVEQIHVPLFSISLNINSQQPFQFTQYVSPPPITDITIINSVFLI